MIFVYKDGMIFKIIVKCSDYLFELDSCVLNYILGDVVFLVLLNIKV